MTGNALAARWPVYAQAWVTHALLSDLQAVAIRIGLLSSGPAIRSNRIGVRSARRGRKRARELHAGKE